jgi:fluoride exporter
VTWLWVALGSAVGGVLRYAVARYLPPTPGGWPLATFAVNLVGSMAIGFIYPWVAARGVAAEGVRLFWMTGVLGGFTTYSAFALETSLLGVSGNTAVAVGYVVATVFGCLGAAFAGRALGLLIW